MAVTSTPNLGSGVLNVSSIVSALMAVEQQPVTALETKIGKASSNISMLGTFMAKASALQTALSALSSAASFGSRSATSTNAGLVTATATSSAAVGDLDISVSRSARAQQTLLSHADFTTAAALVGVGSVSLVTSDNATGLTVATSATDTLATLAAKINIKGQQTLLTNAAFTSAGALVGGGGLTLAITAGATIGTTVIPTTAGTTTLSSLAADINAGSYGVTAAVKQQDDGTFGLQLTSTSSGGTFTAPTAIGAYTPTAATTTAPVYGVTASVVKTAGSSFGLLLSGVSTGLSQSFTAPATIGSYNPVTVNTVAPTDAALTLNGVDYTSASNNFSNVLSGVSLQLNQSVTTVVGTVPTTTARLTVAAQSASATTAVQAVATAYNDMLVQYKSLTRSGADPATRGPLNGDSTLNTFMYKVRVFFNAGAYDSTGTNHVTWSASGVTFQRDGTLAVDSKALGTALSGTLGTILSNGLYMGSTSSTSDLRAFMSSSALSTGLLGADNAGRKTSLAALNAQKSKLTAKLATIQATYTKRYAALDAQLTTMQQTSTALASALSGLVGSTSGQ